MTWFTVPLCLWALASCVCIAAFTAPDVTQPVPAWWAIPFAIVLPPTLLLTLAILFVLEKFFWLIAKLTGELK